MIDQSNRYVNVSIKSKINEKKRFSVIKKNLLKNEISDVIQAVIDGNNELH